MEEKRTVDKLAGYFMKAVVLAFVLALCWYFRNVLIYIIVAFVISLIGFPIMQKLRKINIKGHYPPSGLLAAVTIVVILAFLAMLITQMIPLVSRIMRDVSMINITTYFNENPIHQFNAWLVGLFPDLGSDFNVIDLLMLKMKEIVNINNVSGLIGSVASVVSNLFVALFSVIFISFFFLKDDTLFEKIVSALVPDNIEKNIKKTIIEIKHLLSRYFLGLMVEIIGVAMLDFLGLWLIAKLDITYAIGIAFIAGLLNVIPYLGPLIGEVIGMLFGVVLKIGTGTGLDVNIWAFALIILAIMLTVQLVDNFIYQPLIYSTSIKAHPLEIFIVLLMAGHVGGTVGMLVAIPAYTVVRVVAIRFFYRYKLIQRLIPDLSKEDELIYIVDD